MAACVFFILPKTDVLLAQRRKRINFSKSGDVKLNFLHIISRIKIWRENSMIRACPFCGAEAKVCRSRKKNDLQVYVRCNSCGAQTKRRRAKEIRDADDLMNQSAVGDIVRLWNSGIAKRPQRDSYEHRSFDFLTHDSILNTCSERCIR